jgi:hypothetical protein
VDIQGVTMQNAKRAFREILMIELDDLQEDVNHLIGLCSERHIKEEITNYVHLENKAFFQNEMLGIKGYREDVRRFDPDLPENTDEMAAALKRLLSDRVRQHDIAPALIPLVERKIDKVLRYLKPHLGI